MQMQLVEAYLELSFRIGIELVTLQKVADEAKVAFGSVRYHFVREGQPDLMSAATTYVVLKGYQAIETRLSADRSRKTFNPLHSYVNAMFEWTEKSRKESSYLLYFYYRCGTRNELALSNETLVDTARRRIRQLMSESVGLGLYPKLPSDLDHRIKRIHALLLGALVVAGTERRADAFGRQRDVVLKGIDEIMAKKSKSSR